MIDADPDQAEFWRIESRPYDPAAKALLWFAAAGGAVLVIYSLGSILGAWQ